MEERNFLKLLPPPFIVRQLDQILFSRRSEAHFVSFQYVVIVIVALGLIYYYMRDEEQDEGKKAKNVSISSVSELENI